MFDASPQTRSSGVSDRCSCCPPRAATSSAGRNGASVRPSFC
jgi:hypothetical protein